jgi:tetratricopeptide (TPR) repeat protein
VSRSRLLALIAIPSLLLAVLYSPALDFGFVWMDHAEIEKGNMVLPLDQVGKAFFRPADVITAHSQEQAVSPYYRPLQLVVVSLIHNMYGLDARHYHLVSLVVGLLYAAAVAFMALALFGRFWPSLMVTLLVISHPSGIEPIAWLSAVSETMGGIWILGSLIAALACLRATTQRESLVFGVLSWLALTGGLLSKETSVILPALLFALLVSIHFTGQPDGCVSVKQSATVRVLVGAQVLTVLGYLLILRPAVLGVVVGEAPEHGSWITQWLTALSLWPRSIAWLFVPVGSTSSDVVHVVTTFANPWAWLGLLLALASLLAWIVLLRMRRGIAAFGLAWLWIAYLPTANLAPMIHARGDRYLFLSTVGAALLTVSLGPDLLGRLVPRYRRVVVTVLAVVCVAALAGLTRARLPVWESTLTLFEHDVAFDPEFREGRFHIANQYYEQRNFRVAQAELETLLGQLETADDIKSYVNMLGVYQLSCSNLAAQSKFAEAVKFARDAIGTYPEMAVDPAILDCLGQSLERTGKLSEALDTYHELIDHLHRQPPPGILLAIARCDAALGRPEEARIWLRKALDMGLQNRRQREEASRIDRLIGGPEAAADGK